MNEEETNYEEEGEATQDRHVYGDIRKPCPFCGLLTLEEETLGYEKVIYCVHCSYSESKTI